VVNHLCAQTKSSSLYGGFEIKISSRRFLLKNENVEGVLMSPFFKDMAVSNA